jgi:putative methionine-R-sulfoxide reductase with GAF domain
MDDKGGSKRDNIYEVLNQPLHNWQKVLSVILSSFDCTTGTIHILEPHTTQLKLEAYQGVPEFLIPKLSEIPVGKGMAGIAAERRQPVEMCNLQTDASGIARPAAKETRVEGSIAVPMMLEGILYGTLGVAKSIPYNFSQEEVGDLLNIGAEISRLISQQNT